MYLIKTNGLLFISITFLLVLFSCSHQSVQEEVVIGEGSAYPLEGILTLPSAHEPVPAVVLVHGSGPSDRDQSVYSYNIFKDLAQALTEQEIAVLRYDKRTYTYQDSFTEEDLLTFTVYEETVEDAVRAIQHLQNDSRIDNEKIFLIGHSQGGMLAPRIYDASENLAGLIIMAGSPRPLWEIIYDQNLAILEDLDPDSTLYETNHQQLITEYEKAQQLADLTLEESINETIFGLPGYYLKEMESFNSEAVLREQSVPLLILQGEKDFQVNVEKDFEAYQSLLADRDHAHFILYPDLNHFFINYQGEGKGTIEEYHQGGHVEDVVIDDIVNWIKHTSD
ncbi:alpha/beta fold hydrolase [Amphibacillus cookii]|uniref:alpha/beta fold hydrolase n=1 Tax=Amphibacillus cookii TaxID=767787 RepID=UPI00195685AD|nr:putative esterase [Amphibacillus cookii]